MSVTFTSTRPGQHILNIKSPSTNGEGVIAPDVRKDYKLVDTFEQSKLNPFQLLLERFCIIFAVYGADLLEKPIFLLLFCLAVVLPCYFVIFHFFGIISFLYKYTPILFPVIVFSILYLKINQKSKKVSATKKAKIA